jgi:hypothetical protein
MLADLRVGKRPAEMKADEAILYDFAAFVTSFRRMRKIS